MAVLETASHQFATLSLHRTDTIRFTQFPDDVYTKVESLLRKSWPPGVQSEGQFHGSYEYKLKGKPWGALGKVESVGSRVLLRDILAYLYSAGWIIVTSLDLSERVGTKDTMIFKRNIDTSPRAFRWFVVAFARGNHMYLYCDGEDRQGLIDDYRGVLARLEFFKTGQEFHDAYDFELNQNAWRARGGDKAMKVRRLMLAIVELMDARGWTSYTTVKQRQETEDVRVCDSWYFVRATD